VGQTKEDELVGTLASAEVAAPQLVARVLNELTLAPAELGQLDNLERAEFVDSMRGAGVPLGDRFRVRRMSDILRTSTGQVHLEFVTPASSSETTMDAFQLGSSRALQSERSSGVSGDSIALMLTALLGIGSFIVQAVAEKRAARAATATQKELDRELAAREASRNIAAVQLDRVRLQMGEVARPLQYAAGALNYSLWFLGMEMSAAWGISVFGMPAECTFSPPTEPHTVVLDLSKHIRSKAVINSLAMDSEGIARLEAEPSWRERWVETWLSMEPFLNTIEDIIQTKAHLAEPVKISGLEKIPFVELGRSWDEAFGSAGSLYLLVVMWVRQWCVLVHHCFWLARTLLYSGCLPTLSGFACCAHSFETSHNTNLILYCVTCRVVVRARWARDIFDRLQPTAPGFSWPLAALANFQGAACGARETKLQVSALTPTGRPARRQHP
jgi:hypothetical protein